MGDDQRRFGIWTLTFLVVANMIGAGVFTTSGFTLADLRNPWLVVAAWVVAGLIAAAGAYSYGLLSQVMPESGGEYLFLSRAAHPSLGFIAGWVSLIAGFTGAIAFAATAFESYTFPDESRPSWLPADTIAIAVILLSGGFHGLRARLGSNVQNVAVALKLGLIVCFLLYAGTRTQPQFWQGTDVSGPALSLWETIAAFAGSLVWISLSYSGFNAAVYVAGEAKVPERTVPRALLSGTLIVTAAYVLLNAVFVLAPPPDLLVTVETVEGTTNYSGSPQVATIAAGWLGGQFVSGLVRAVILLALLTSVSSMMMAAPRVYAKMADDGFLPKAIRFQADAPRNAIILQMLIATIVVLVSTLKDLLSYLGLVLSLSAALSVSCLFLPKLRPARRGTLSLLLPAFFVTATCISAAIMTTNQPGHLVGLAATVVTGLVGWKATMWLGRPDRPHDSTDH